MGLAAFACRASFSDSSLLPRSLSCLDLPLAASRACDVGFLVPLHAFTCLDAAVLVIGVGRMGAEPLTSGPSHTELALFSRSFAQPGTAAATPSSAKSGPIPLLRSCACCGPSASLVRMVRIDFVFALSVASTLNPDSPLPLRTNAWLGSPTLPLKIALSGLSLPHLGCTKHVAWRVLA